MWQRQRRRRLTKYQTHKINQQILHPVQRKQRPRLLAQIHIPTKYKFPFHEKADDADADGLTFSWENIAYRHTNSFHLKVSRRRRRCTRAACPEKTNTVYYFPTHTQTRLFRTHSRQRYVSRSTMLRAVCYSDPNSLYTRRERSSTSLNRLSATAVACSLKSFVRIYDDALRVNSIKLCAFEDTTHVKCCGEWGVGGWGLKVRANYVYIITRRVVLCSAFQRYATHTQRSTHHKWIYGQIFIL